MTDRDTVAAELLEFFRSICANPEAIQDIQSDVRNFCGYSSNLVGWRGLFHQINRRPSILRLRLRLDPTDLDNVRTIAGIMSKLRRFAAFGSVKVSVSPAALRYLATKADTRTPRQARQAIVARGDRSGRQRFMSARMVMALTNKKDA